MKTLVALAVPLLAVALPAAAATIEQLRHQRRVLLLSAPTAADPQLAVQRHALAGWRQGAADRDIDVVEVIGNEVRGAGDAARALRQRYALPDDRFAASLIGKDGHVALRSARAVPAPELERTIDAMPMRRAGER